MAEITVFWTVPPSPGNLGDVLAPVLLERLGYSVTWAPKEHAALFATGSIIKFARPGMMVWGSGAARVGDMPSPGARYLSVRGPLTRQIVLREGGTCPEIYGDPALLLPELYDRPVPKLHDVGLIPHYIDADDPKVPESGLPCINVLRANPLEVVDEIRACRSIISSSLHGLIVAHAYGIPAAWIRFGDRICGDGTKFRDHAAALGIDMPCAERVDDVSFVRGSCSMGAMLRSLEAALA